MANNDDLTLTPVGGASAPPPPPAPLAPPTNVPLLRGGAGTGGDPRYPPGSPGNPDPAVAIARLEAAKYRAQNEAREAASGGYGGGLWSGSGGGWADGFLGWVGRRIMWRIIFGVGISIIIAVGRCMNPGHRSYYGGTNGGTAGQSAPAADDTSSP